MTDLAEFLLARVAEDEARAQADAEWADNPDAYQDVDTRLADCADERRFIEEGERLLRLWAVRYADHADYREEWLP